MDEWFVQLDRLPDFSPEQKGDLQEILNDPQRVKDPNALFSDPESAVRRLQKLLARTGRSITVRCPLYPPVGEFKHLAQYPAYSIIV